MKFTDGIKEQRNHLKRRKLWGYGTEIYALRKLIDDNQNDGVTL